MSRATVTQRSRRQHHRRRRTAPSDRVEIDRELNFIFTLLLPRRPGHGPPAEQMKMKMKDGLATVAATVRHDPIALFQ